MQELQTLDADYSAPSRDRIAADELGPIAGQLFRGQYTPIQTSVYPREVVKEALARNASALLLVHNHPSGSTTPSRADEMLTQTLRTALALVDIRVLDHLIVGGDTLTSMAEQGLL